MLYAVLPLTRGSLLFVALYNSERCVAVACSRDSVSCVCYVCVGEGLWVAHCFQQIE